VAEAKSQAATALDRYGHSLVAHLDALGLLDPRFSAAHGIWIDRDDISRLAGHGCGIVTNPMSNLRLGSGVAPVRAMLEGHVRVGIGTDATNTSDGQNMFEATRLCATLSRIGCADPARWIAVDESFAAATHGSAAILGFERVGKLLPGWRADIVFIDLAHITYVPLRDPLLQLVLAESGAAVDSVMVDGRLIMSQGKLLTIDEQRLRAMAEEAATRLDAANARARRLALQLQEAVGIFCAGQAHAHPRLERRLNASF
jgi:guanine deaminase